MVKKKKVVETKETTLFGLKKNTALTIGALVVVVVLLNNYGVLTGSGVKGQVYPANLHTVVTANWTGSVGTYQLKVLNIAEDAKAISMSVDGGNPKTVWKTGCAENNEPIFVGNGRYNSMGNPYGVHVYVCEVASNDADIILVSGI